MLTDQEKGLVLAISSSVFIGSSFIIKKKGLRRAGASGIRAGAPARDARPPRNRTPHLGVQPASQPV